MDNNVKQKGRSITATVGILSLISGALKSIFGIFTSSLDWAKNLGIIKKKPNLFIIHVTCKDDAVANQAAQEIASYMEQKEMTAYVIGEHCSLSIIGPIPKENEFLITKEKIEKKDNPKIW